ncbi:MAG: molybdopterin dinucleotide binding domain-containing protein [Anaerolineae bacterium]
MSHLVTRRDFLRMGAAGVASAVLAGCQKPRRWVDLEPYVRPPEEQLAGVATWYASTCRQCPAGCGIVVRTMNGRALKIEGNPEHPLNRGKLCARGQAGLQLLYNPDRLAGPVQQAQRGSRQFQSLDWGEAINALYDKLQMAGGAVAVWTGSTTSGHLSGLFQRFTSALGAPDPLVFDLYTALHGYHELAATSGTLFGQPELPAYDLGSADVVLSFGADLLGTGLSAVHYGVEYGKFRSQQLGKRGYLVQLEPRQSTTGAVADRWLPVRPGSEALVATALLRIIADEALGLDERVTRARALAGEVDVNSIATASDLAVEELYELARVFATADRPLAIPGATLAGGMGAESAVAAVQVLNAVAGTVGLSSEPPPSNLAKGSISSFTDVQALIETMRGGKVEVLLVHGANPSYDLPEKAGFLDAVSQVPHVVSFNSLVDETAVQADLILPDRTYLESWGYEVVSPGFGLPIVSSQQPVAASPFDVRSTADVLLTVARGIPDAASALPWADEVAYLKESIAQLPPGAAGGSGEEMLWARFLQHGGWWPAQNPEIAPPSQAPSEPIQVSSPAFQGDEGQYPYFLHLYISPLLSDGRGANLPWLQGSPAPMTTMAWQSWVEMHPDTAGKIGVADGDVVRVTSPHGELEAPVYIYPAIRPDTVAMPTGQGHSDYGRYARDRGSNPMTLIGAETGSSGSSLSWADVRVQVAPTGRQVAMARFENREGVVGGFVNQAFPGQ